MKRFLAMILAVMMVLSCTGAVAEWLYATDGQTFVHPNTDVDSERIGVFEQGQKIWVYNHVYTDDGRNWCEVNFKGKWGYISDRYSSYEVVNPDRYKDVNNGRYDYDYDDYDYDYDDYDDAYFEYEEDFEFEVTRNTKVRAWAGNDARSIGSCGRGSVVWGSMLYPSEDGQVWLEVIWDDTQYGYISTRSLQLTEPMYDSSYPSFGAKVRVTGGRVNVRQEPNINSKDLDTVHKGDVFNVDYYVCVEDGERRVWAHCLDEDGNDVGFISCIYLTAK